MVGILATWLPTTLRVAWALFGTVVLIAHPVITAMQKRPSSMLTEAGDFFVTEAGDRIILE